MENWLNRTELLIGKESLDKLKNSCIAVFGCGGVGSYVIEGLVRAGVGNLIVIDNDIVDITNINRQLIADTSTVGLPKVEVEKRRALLINPKIQINIFQKFADASNFHDIIPNNCDYIIDAIDTVSSKISLITYAYEKGIPIISSMGTGNKLDPTRFEITDISKTSVCPLAKVMRKELKNRGINNTTVIYSKEEPKKSDSNNKTISSISYVPSVCGLMIAGKVVNDIIG